MCGCLFSKNLELRSLCDKLLASVMELCQPRPKKSKKKSKSGKKKKNGKKSRRGGGRGGEGKRSRDDSEESTSESESETDSDDADSEEESKYSPSRSMDEMDAVEEQRVAVFELVRRKRFEAHNREWLDWARDEDMAEGGGRYAEQPSSRGDGYGGRYGGGVGGYQDDGGGGGQDLDDSGQWMVGSGRHENIAVDMALLGGEEDTWDGGGGGGGGHEEGKSYY